MERFCTQIYLETVVIFLFSIDQRDLKIGMLTSELSIVFVGTSSSSEKFHPAPQSVINYRFHTNDINDDNVIPRLYSHSSKVNFSEVREFI